MTQKLYNEMTTEEQLRWVQDFSDVLNKSGERIRVLAKDNRAQWTANDHRTVARLFTLLGAWPFAQDFVAKAQRYGDYDRRAYRLPLYIEKVNGLLADGLTMTDERGRAVAVVLPGMPMRRRGRPTNEEVAARQRGKAVIPTDDSPETRKRRLIAQMLGLEVVGGEPQREKNNAELKAERDKRKAEEAKMNPSLFEAENGPGMQGENAAAGSVPSDSVAGISPCAQLMSDSYEMRMAQDKLHLDQLAWMCSKPLQERIKLVQSQRTAAESASERAKTMADLGQPADAIAEYTQQAKVATEAYLQTYADIDEELAILHKRLYLDLPFVEQFKQRFKGVDIEKIQYITRPYYEKVKKESPEIDVRIRTIIEQENPEYAAKMKAEEEKKQEVSELLRYLKRKDKPNVKQRIETMEKRYQRLIELLGEEEAKVYRPIVDAAIEDYEANHKKPTVVSDSLTKDQSVALQSVADKKKPAKKGAKKETKKTTKPAKK